MQNLKQKIKSIFLLVACSAALACQQQNVKMSKDQAQTSIPAIISFNEHVQPIFSEYCYHCHGPDAGTRMPTKEPLRLDIEKDAFTTRDFGAPVIVKGSSEQSELVRLMHSKDSSEIMPPPESHKTMSAHDIATVERWIEQGANYENHWSYDAIVRPEHVKNSWSDKPIDGFIFEKLQQVGLQPANVDDISRFYRRLSLDLTGLPPDPGNTERFIQAYTINSEAAVEAEADRMLATIQSAEHFARYWLDAARYADTHGIHIDNYRGIWPYRDWVVQAFYKNMKWDQFTTEQLAGDLLPNRTLDQHVATGFLRSIATTGEGGAINDEYDAIYAVDRVDTMSGIWLGLTASCASCHDHKFDPFSQKDFYQFAAFFRNNTTTTLDGNNAEHAPAIFVAHEKDRTHWAQIQTELQILQAETADHSKIAKSMFEVWLAENKSQPASVAHAKHPLLAEENLSKEQTEILFESYVATNHKLLQQLLNKDNALKAEQEKMKSRGSTSLVYEERSDQAAAAYVLERGAYTAPGEKVFADTPAMLPPMPANAPKNRLGLAQWLNDANNPLPARVTMNRLWANFFGAGIVSTAGDFGIIGARPSHAKLLDWLAAEFLSSGFDYRHMAKTIATSYAYRQSSRVDAQKLEKDYANTFVSRGPRLRLDAEQIRDLLLSASGSLSLRVGGAPVKPYQPAGIWEAVAMPQSNTKSYVQDSGEASYRRSLYTFIKRTAGPPVMEIFDAPQRGVSCLQRERTNTPLQALALMNDPQFVEAKRVLAAAALKDHSTFDARLDYISLRLLSRKFNTSERDIVRSTLHDAITHYAADTQAAAAAISTGAAVTCSTLSVPELAAWSLVASQIFNLDETLTR